MDEQKHAGGRPTDYKPEYCQTVIEFGRQGYSLTAFAGSIEQARSTINLWIDKFPEFMEACKIHKAVRSQALEGQLLETESGPKVTARIFALKNTAPEEWKDRHETVSITMSYEDHLKSLLEG